jgi:tryptophan synthase alpha chain
VIEVGVPFSDPIADGPVIQASSTAALARGMTLRRTLELAAKLSGEVAAPLVLMSYLNPVLRFGVGAFAAEAAAAGVRGVIFPDVSFEESGALRPAMREHGLAYVDLVAPTSGDERVRAIARASEGFVYLVSLTGVTGARAAVADGLPELVARVRAATDTPVYVGFGVSTPEQAGEVARHADGVIIGSRLLTLAAGGEPAGAAQRVGAFLAAARRALDGG